MKKIFLIIALLFTTPTFATGVSGNSGTCDSGALGTDGGSTILRANYEPETIHLRWYDENNNLLTVNSASQSCTYGDSITIPTAPTKTGYRFTGWSVFSDYTPIEYIESTGTQYIDTGISVNGGNIMEAKVLPVGNDDSVFIGNVGPNEQQANYSRNIMLYREGRYKFEKLSTYFGDEHSYVADLNTPAVLYFDTTGNKMYGTCNGTVVVDTTTSYGVLENRPETVSLSHIEYLDTYVPGRYYYLKLWDSNHTLVRDMIPVKDIHGVACMYDKVSGQFFYNQGTGNFIAGPDL